MTIDGKTVLITGAGRGIGPAVVEEAQSVDILVNNVGLATYDDLGDWAVLEQRLAVNLFGTYSVTQALLPLLTRSRGAVVNVLSALGVAAMPAGGREEDIFPDPLSGFMTESWPGSAVRALERRYGVVVQAQHS